MKKDVPQSKPALTARRPTNLDAKTWKSIGSIFKSSHRAQRATGRFKRQPRTKSTASQRSVTTRPPLLLRADDVDRMNMAITRVLHQTDLAQCQLNLKLGGSGS